ncbi:hypothetical protein [Methanobrevibacter filiformis]|uniref:Chlamydia polymorphic membrane protein n=1 Tax=Methanobrevibacter filiformis TaxID=55758 RepID=A0A166CDZ7_9EURY|nr:hypothetical protein [Methanobrevibacter filiformis]KZX14408.1 chlamydia polymorphic membrane protein [Methanobrevibacter filiformis]
MSSDYPLPEIRVYGTQTSNEISVIGSKFINNSATDGGAIYSLGASVSMADDYYYSDMSPIDDDYKIISNFNIINSIFENNTANSGGAIYRSGVLSIYVEFYRTDVAIAQALADNYDIGVYANFNIENSTFTNNTGRFDGGAIYNTGGSSFSYYDYNGINQSIIEAIFGDINYGMNIKNSVFTKNTINNASSSNNTGGAIYNKDNLNLTNSSFIVRYLFFDNIYIV